MQVWFNTLISAPSSNGCINTFIAAHLILVFYSILADILTGTSALPDILMGAEKRCTTCTRSEDTITSSFVPLLKQRPLFSPLNTKAYRLESISRCSAMPGTFGNRTPGSPLTLDDVAVPIDCYSPASIDTLLATPYGLSCGSIDYFSIPVSFDGTGDFRGRSDFVMELPDRSKRSMRNRSCESSPALIKIIPSKELPYLANPIEADVVPSLSTTVTTNTKPYQVTMAYNEYGELANLEKLQTPLTPTEMTTTQILRVIRRAYHHEVSISDPFRSLAV
jgi:hypothetical protein